MCGNQQPVDGTLFDPLSLPLGWLYVQGKILCPNTVQELGAFLDTAQPAKPLPPIPVPVPPVL